MVCAEKESREISFNAAVCKKWIHGRCSGVKGCLTGGSGYQSFICSDKVQKLHGCRAEIGEDKIECVSKFCYLADMLGAG